MTERFDQARNLAERNILSAAMCDKVSLVLAVEALRTPFFASGVHRAVFAILAELSAKNIDVTPVEVARELQQQANPLLDMQGVFKLAEGYVVPVELESSIRLVVLRHSQDRLIAEARKMLSALEGNYAESLDELETHLAFLDQGYHREQSAGHSDLVEYQACLAESADKIEQQRGLLTGFTELDKHIDLRPGQLMTIYGDTGSKKTTLCMNLVARWAKQKRIAVYNYEQQPIEVARMVSDVDQYAEIPAGNLWISRQPPALEALAAQVKAIKIKRGLDGIVVDYIQTIPALTKSLAENENEFIRYAMRNLRDLAQRESIWIIIVAQMRKSQTDIQDHLLNPTLDKMRGSGEIKMASSIILSTVLPWKCGVKNLDSLDTEFILHVRIKKNRDCLTGNPGEEKEVKLIHQHDNRLITSFNPTEHYLSAATEYKARQYKETDNG